MLDPWIIEEIRRREEEERQRREQPPQLEIPMESPAYHEHGGKPQPSSDGDRGVTIVDFAL